MLFLSSFLCGFFLLLLVGTVVRPDIYPQPTAGATVGLCVWLSFLSLGQESLSSGSGLCGGFLHNAKCAALHGLLSKAVWIE